MTHDLHNRSILLIISGGIAAYKGLDLIRRLREEGAQVRCVLTEGGAQFITPTSIAALTGEPVHTDMFPPEGSTRIDHINLTRQADLVVVAPATANIMARMAHGLADNLAAALLLATDKPVMIAPAMNVMMWRHPATQANVATLKKRGIVMVGPAKGAMACDEEGEGRMANVADILAAIEKYFSRPGPLTGRKALVTSGPTHEPLDPVRFIGNRSSGKQGHAIALALARQGAEVTLVTGPVTLPDPVSVKTVHVKTARDMLAACEKALPVDIAVCAAAVADWRPVKEVREKMKKGKGKPALDLAENPDILAALAQAGKKRPRLVIGFAAETNNMIALASEKFERKKCDWILANEVGEGKGFSEDDNELILLRRAAKGKVKPEIWPRQSKDLIARHLVEEIVAAFKRK